MDEGEALAQMIAVTNASAPQARQCLEACNWQLEQAIELYFASAAADVDEVGLAEHAERIARGTALPETSSLPF